MEIEITANMGSIDFGASGVTEIIQNIRTILATPKYSVPLNREFGVDLTMLDAPLPIAKARFSAEVIQAIQRWEPRAKVIKVTYEGNATEGILRPKVRVRIDES